MRAMKPRTVAAVWRFVLRLIRHIERATRPVHPDTAAALERRWAELPDRVKGPEQLLGRHTAGCEGTHGVFPRCNLACTPCYHAKEANRVRTDGEHTIRKVEAHMALLRKRRGTGQHAQLIGGEVTLLSPEDHARTLEVMQRHGRKPMSMTHGDFDYEHLERLAVAPDGRRRFSKLVFAGHFDSLMYGRRGIIRARAEAQLNPYRQRFVEMFRRLEREHGVRFDLAHNMTVTPRNLDQVAQVIRDNLRDGWGMFSFQPAAYVGNPNRWREELRAFDVDALWTQMERGAGARLPWRHLQMGDARCNRSAYGALVGERWVPWLNDRCAADLRVRDLFLDAVGGMDAEAGGWDRLLRALRVARLVAGRRGLVRASLRWGGRFARRAGVWPLVRHGIRPVTFVVHAFMDARDVAPAWDALRRGEVAEEPRVRAAQERLQACSYAMAHPESGELVPACVQHCVLDPRENLALMRELPLAAPATR